MEYEDTRTFNFISGFLCGAAAGAAIALLAAPASGRKTRKRLHRAADDFRDEATARWDEVADDVRHRVEEVLDGARKRFS